MREFWCLKDAGRVKYVNNATREIKDYEMIINRELTTRKVAYVEGLQQNLIHVSQLILGIGLKVSFNDEGSKILPKESKKVLLKSRRK